MSKQSLRPEPYLLLPAIRITIVKMIYTAGITFLKPTWKLKVNFLAHNDSTFLDKTVYSILSDTPDYISLAPFAKVNVYII